MKRKSGFDVNAIEAADALACVLDVSEMLSEIGIDGSTLPVRDRLAKESMDEAASLLDVANHSTVLELQAHIEKHRPNALTIAFLTLAVQRNAITAFRSEQARERASATRWPVEKMNARRIWDEWKAGRANYRNKTAFCDALVYEFGISMNTARRWFDDFKAEDRDAEFRNAIGTDRKSNS